LQPQFIGPFPTIQKIDRVAYRLALTLELQGIHDVFHVSQLRQYIEDADHVVNDEVIELTPDLSYDEKSIRTLEHGEKELRHKRILLAKVLWNHHPVRDVT
jgi:hypothetical protein